MNYSNALKLLNSFDNFERLKRPHKSHFLNLDRMRFALARLENPQNFYPSILIGGTNGKGSTAFYLAESLRASGYRVGLYTSPHLEDVRERIQVNGRMISRQDFAFESKKASKLKFLNSLLGRLTYFEWLTLLAFSFFARKKVDIAILEVGLGGRLDATNVMDPFFSIITPISLDHTRILGGTLTKIAGEKAFLIHPGRSVILAEQKTEVMRVLKKRMRQVSATLWTKKSRVSKAQIQNKPLYLIQNFSLVLSAIKLLKEKFGFKKIAPQKAFRIFRNKVWPGRFEHLGGQPSFLLDGAHNPAGARVLAKALAEVYPSKNKILVCGFAGDKNYDGALRELRAVKPALVIAVQFKNPRTLSASKLATTARRHFRNVQMAVSVPEALRLAKKMAKRDDLIVVTGSLFLIAEARRFLKSA